MDLLMLYPWPGNVRELENVLSGAGITAESAFIDVTDLPPHLQKPCPGSLDPAGLGDPILLDEVKRRHIAHILELCEGNIARAAEMLGIGRTSLYRYLKRQEETERDSAGTETEPDSMGRPGNSGGDNPQGL